MFMDVSDLDIPPVIQRHLSGAGIKTVAQLTRLTRAEVRSMHGMGEKVTDRLESALAAHGFQLKQP